MSHDEQAATLKHQDIVALLKSHEQLAAECADLKQQLAWFKQQIFGQKSERRPVEPDPRQLALLEGTDAPADGAEEITVAEHVRRRQSATDETPDVETLRFDPSVPVEEILIPAPGMDEEHEVVSEKVTFRLAQKPASFVVLKYIRPVIKSKSDGTLRCAPAPATVLGKSLADVSFLAQVVIDKFKYYLPLYRQHLRLEAGGIRLARSTLTGLVHRVGDLLQPIHDAQLASILTGPVLAMDETPIKAGREAPGKLKTGYFWPIYGTKGEVAFPFSETRSSKFLFETLGGYSGILLSDGYAAYESYAGQIAQVVHAQCWSHTRRQFLKAEQIEPELTAKALDNIRRLYLEEARIGPKLVEPTKRVELRALHAKPIVDEFFEWLKTTLAERILLPRNPFTEAAHYALAREKALRVFLEYPDVPLDTNHLEREIRPVALGRKNWMFCWTEVGAQYVGVFQSLLGTCRLQGVDTYTYLVDVLQRVESHPAKQVALLTPRLWKEHFAANPLRSAVDRIVKDADF